MPRPKNSRRWSGNDHDNPKLSKFNPSHEYVRKSVEIYLKNGGKITIQKPPGNIFGSIYWSENFRNMQVV